MWDLLDERGSDEALKVVVAGELEAGDELFGDGHRW
jgi:hypothetical protein